jgi:hypothetical protein
MRERAIDWRPDQGFIADATPDPEVLQFAAGNGRVLVSADLKTMGCHFAVFVAAQTSPGLILMPSGVPVGEAIERLLMTWAAWSAEDIENQLWWLPQG